MKKNMQSITKRLISTLLVLVIVMTMLPAATTETNAATASEVLYNKYINALQYMYKSLGYGAQDPYALLWGQATTKIPYGATPNGDETTPEGKPDVSLFKSQGLVCASFVAYVLFNYLPNELDDHSYDWFYEDWIANKLTYGHENGVENFRYVPYWYKATNEWVSKGKAVRYGNAGGGSNISVLKDAPIGSVVFFRAKSTNDLYHVAIFLGYFADREGIYYENQKYIFLDLGDNNGPKVTNYYNITGGTVTGAYLTRSGDTPNGETLIFSHAVALDATFGEGSITKSTTSGMNRDGYCFQLYNNNTQDLYRFKTNTSGQACVADGNFNITGGSTVTLENGTYTFKELLRTDKDTKLKSMVFKVDGTQIASVTWNGSSYVTTGGIGFEEVTPSAATTNNPAGYRVSNLVLNDIENGKALSIEVTNDDINKQVRIQVTKKDSSSGATIAGATFQIWEGTPNATGSTSHGTITTGTNGVATSGYFTLTSSSKSNWYLVETYVPEPYILDSTPIPVTVTASSLTSQQTTLTKTVKNDPKQIRIQVTKKDSLSGATIVGATFQIWEGTPNATGSKSHGIITTGTNGVATSGYFTLTSSSKSDWYLVETYVPEPYVLDSTPILVTVTASSLTSQRTTLTKAVENDKEFQIIINKEAADLAGVGLEGHKFVLQERGEFVFAGVSDEDGHVYKTDANFEPIRDENDELIYSFSYSRGQEVEFIEIPREGTQLESFKFKHVSKNGTETVEELTVADGEITQLQSGDYAGGYIVCDLDRLLPAMLPGSTLEITAKNRMMIPLSISKSTDSGRNKGGFKFHIVNRGQNVADIWNGTYIITDDAGIGHESNSSYSVVGDNTEFLIPTSDFEIHEVIEPGWSLRNYTVEISYYGLSTKRTFTKYCTTTADNTKQYASFTYSDFNFAVGGIAYDFYDVSGIEITANNGQGCAVSIVKKAADGQNVPLNGHKFVLQHDQGREILFYGVSDTDGRVYQTESDFTTPIYDDDDEKIYTIEVNSLGYQFLELIEIPAPGTTLESISFVQTDVNGNTTAASYDENSQEWWHYETGEFAGGYCVDYLDMAVNAFAIGGSVVFTATNGLTNPVEVTLKKEAASGQNVPLAGHKFVLRHAGGVLFYGISDSNGDVYQTDSSFENPVYNANNEKIYKIIIPSDENYYYLELIEIPAKGSVLESFKFFESGSGGNSITTYNASDQNWEKYNSGIYAGGEGICGLEGGVFATGGSVSITAKNACALGSIEVAKYDLDGCGIARAVFQLMYSTDGGRTWEEIRPLADGEAEGTIGTCTSEGLTDTGELEVLEENDYTVYFTGLWASPDILYQVIETQNPPGFVGKYISDLIKLDGHESVVYCEAYNTPLGSIEVLKLDLETNAPLAGATFMLEYYDVGDEEWYPVRLADEDEIGTPGTCTSDLLSTNGCLVTDENGVAVFEGLHIATNDYLDRYRVREVEAPEGYLLSSAAKEISVDDLYDAENYEILFTAYNREIGELPDMGGNEVNLFVTTGIVLIGASAFVYIFLRKRKKQISE